MNKQEFDAQPENDRFNRVLEGEIYYASVHSPNFSAVEKYNADPFFGVSLGLEGAELDKAKAWGLRVVEPNDFIPMPHVVVKRKVKEGKTEDEVRPSVVDEVQNQIPKNILIGNGSHGLVKFATYWYEAGGGGVGSTLFKLQVTKLLEFKRSDTVDSSLKMNEDGFSISEYLSIGSNDADTADTAVVEDDAPVAKEEDAKEATNKDIFDD